MRASVPMSLTAELTMGRVKCTGREQGEGAHIWCGRCRRRGPCSRWRGREGPCSSGPALPGHSPSTRRSRRTPRRCGGCRRPPGPCAPAPWGRTAAARRPHLRARAGTPAQPPIHQSISKAYSQTSQDMARIYACGFPFYIAVVRKPVTFLYQERTWKWGGTKGKDVLPTNGTKGAKFRGHELLDRASLLGCGYQLGLSCQGWAVHGRHHLWPKPSVPC